LTVPVRARGGEPEPTSDPASVLAEGPASEPGALLASFPDVVPASPDDGAITASFGASLVQPAEPTTPSANQHTTGIRFNATFATSGTSPPRTST
jgi:hypothetical protein